jgi:hypothetical protein
MRYWVLVACLLAAGSAMALPAPTGSVNTSGGQSLADSRVTRDANQLGAPAANASWSYPNSGGVAIPTRCAVCELGTKDGSPCLVDGDCTGGGTCIDAVCPFFDCDGGAPVEACMMSGPDTYHPVPVCGAQYESWVQDVDGSVVCSANEGVIFKWVEFTEYDVGGPSCDVGDLFLFGDDSENKLKKCQDGVVSDIGQAGVLAMVDENEIEITPDVTTQRCGATMSCYEDAPNKVGIDVDLSDIDAPTELELNTAGAATRNIDQVIPAIYNFMAGKLQIGGRPPLEAPTIKVFCDNFALDTTRRYCSWPTGAATATSSSAAERMAFPCSNLRTITATFRNPSTGATTNYPAANTMTIGFAVDGDIPGATRCTYSGGGAPHYSCDDLDVEDVWDRNDFVATWIGNSGSPASTEQLDVVIQVYCGP